MATDSSHVAGPLRRIVWPGSDEGYDRAPRIVTNLGWPRSSRQEVRDTICIRVPRMGNGPGSYPGITGPGRAPDEIVDRVSPRVS
jgi:hypothetical protein